MRFLAITSLFLSLLFVSVGASATDTSGGTKSGGAGVVASFELEGIHLGMKFDEALAILTENGFTMEGPRPPNSQVGIRVEGKSVTEDQKGSVNILLSAMDGTVYQIQEQVTYWPGRLPEGQTLESLEQAYKEKFVQPFEKARYRFDDPLGRIYFDDATPPPYERPATTPHAEVFVQADGRSGMGASLNLTWKGLVGAKW